MGLLLLMLLPACVESGAKFGVVCTDRTRVTRCPVHAINTCSHRGATQAKQPSCQSRHNTTRTNIHLPTLHWARQGAHKRNTSVDWGRGTLVADSPNPSDECLAYRHSLPQTDARKQRHP